MAGSSAARCPRFAATVSPGTRLVSTNVTRVTPTISSAETPSLRTRYRSSGCLVRSPAGRAGLVGAGCADGADIDRPDRVVHGAGHRVRRDDVGRRLDQWDERAAGVEVALQLLVERCSLGRVGCGGRLVGDLVDVRGGGRGPVCPLTDQAAGSEGEVVGRVREVRSPVPEPDLLLAVAVVVQLGGHRPGCQV